ncbi:zinc finger CCCH domain-containing protein 14 isoform X2 [Denticeps clupeoides]|uniref:zinc finger CCCH domain-containing protein 14 isoform X2 n=1 Tax=Denticeps clupeoides TaxID=299321 RepID=UPI0010A31BE0|nr:zinc finger CCCH domain-containing protein 14 isoform X2 [Denticeps clupeoides]
MEIGTEISKKIRAAIKAKLQELGAYVDEELPDYIMVMVANKKSAQQMTDDLSLFLGNNTIRFTVWLHGVLEKLRAIAVEPTSLRPQLYSDASAGSSKSRVIGEDEKKCDEARVLALSERTEPRISSSTHDHHSRASSEKNSSRLTSAVKPLMEPNPAEAIIDIKPDLDDDLIVEDHVEASVTSGGQHLVTVEAPCVRAAPGSSSRGLGRVPDRSTEGQSGYTYGRSSRAVECGSKEFSRKRKAPVASSVVRVQRRGDDSEIDEGDDDDDDEEEYELKSSGLSSRVSLPAKPERKPSLPPAKQANKNLILKAISEAQQSITKTTGYTGSYTSIPQRQTVPVAPRTRSSSEEMNSAIRLVNEHLQGLIPADSNPTRPLAEARSLCPRLQLDVPEEEDLGHQNEYELQLYEVSKLKAIDTRSFIMRKPEVEQTSSVRSRLGSTVQEELHASAPRMVQPREREALHPVSPKFIVTLDGVPSPLATQGDQDMGLDEDRSTDAPVTHKQSVHHRLQEDTGNADEETIDIDEMDRDEDTTPEKRQKVMERCKFWPVCKSGDECMYHHPIAKCKTFPSCKFGDKCLFIHPNCKYDAKCTKPECPFTHVSKSGPTHQLPQPACSQYSSICRFFPECKKMDCLFYHPKPCRFAHQCKRSGCTFYHPPSSVPPRHALKWTKPQSRYWTEKEHL